MGCVWWYDVQGLALIWVFFGGPAALVCAFGGPEAVGAVLTSFPFVSFFMAVPLLLALWEHKWCFVPLWLPLPFAVACFALPWIIFAVRWVRQVKY